MRRLLQETTAYKGMRADVHATLVVFPDEKYLRPLLRECAKAFFGAEEGSRLAKLLDEEHFADCLFLPEEGGKLTAEMGARIVDESVLRPVEGEKKLFVLDNFHTVTPLVQNKLLKSLEEPPAGVYFLLGATNEHAVLPTVRSRVKQIAVPPFSENEIFKALSRMYPDAEGKKEAAAACGGVLSVAETLLKGGGEEFVRAEKFLSGENTEEFCRSLSDKKDAKSFFAAVRLVLRDALLISRGGEKYAARSGEGTRKIARLYPAGAAIRGLSLVESAEREIGFNANFSQCALALSVGLKKERETWQKLQS